MRYNLTFIDISDDYDINGNNDGTCCKDVLLHNNDMESKDKYSNIKIQDIRGDDETCLPLRRKKDSGS